MTDIVKLLRHHADDCEDMGRWATPELAPTLRRAADRIDELEKALRDVLENGSIMLMEECTCESCAPIARARSALEERK